MSHRKIDHCCSCYDDYCGQIFDYYYYSAVVVDVVDSFDYDVSVFSDNGVAVVAAHVDNDHLLSLVYYDDGDDDNFVVVVVVDMADNGVDGDVVGRMVAVNKSDWASVVSSSSVEVETVEIVVVVDCTVGVVDEASLVVKVILGVVGDVVFRMMTVVHMGCFVDPFCLIDFQRRGEVFLLILISLRLAIFPTGSINHTKKKQRKRSNNYNDNKQ